MSRAETSTARVPAYRGILDATVYAVELAVIAAGYFGLAETSALLPAVNPVATPLWPPTGIALSLLLLRGFRIWPAILVGSFAAGMVAGHPLAASGASALGVLLAATAGTWLIARWSEERQIFETPLNVAKFSLIAVASVAVISAAAAVAGALLSGQRALADVAVTGPMWWLADAAGTLVIAPAILLWATTTFSRWNLLETAAVAIGAAVTGGLAFSPLVDTALAGGSGEALLPYRGLTGFLVLAPLTWAAVRGRQRDAATVALVFSGLAVWGYSTGAGPFANIDAVGAQLVLLVLAISVSVAPLLMSAAIAARRATEIRLTAEQALLNREVFETNLSLESARRHFQILIEGVVDYAIFVLDPAGRVASWNSAARQIIGYSSEEIVGKHFGILFRPDERRAGEATRALEKAVQKGRHEVEGWRVRKNGTPFFVTGSVSVIRNGKGELVGFANVIRDATERRDAQEKLVQAREQLAMAQKMEAIGKLTGGIAHDFNNLLMIIGGNAQTFKRLLDPKLPRAIEAIQTAAKRGESLTRQLLTFSRRQHLTPTVVDLKTSVRNMRPMIESSLRGNIVYNEKIDADAWPVMVDLAELELSIVNLAVNARDAMPNGGTFTLSAANVPAADGQGDAFVAIQFSDTGMGIPPNLLSKIFDPFFTTKEVGKGTGLGLSQVYGFAHQAGGTVKAESTVGEGTTITVYVPPCLEKETAAKETPAEARDSQRPTVLVVDDSADVAEVTSSLFEHLGYATVYRDSAEAALKLLDEGSKVDLVFSDIVMPGTIDGVGLASEIRARYPELPVVLTTGYSDAAQAVPSDLRILRKPFDTDTLKGFIQEAVEVQAALQ